MPEFEKTLIVVRHAHRDTTYRDADNGLSDKGKRQAESIASHVHKVFGNKNLKLKSSPKLRCQETLIPLARLTQQEIEIEELLNERGPTETENYFFERIKALHQKWLNDFPPYVCICSHGDWIPEFCQLAFNQRIDLDKGGLLEAKLVGSQALIFELKQKLTP